MVFYGEWSIVMSLPEKLSVTLTLQNSQSAYLTIFGLAATLNF